MTKAPTKMASPIIAITSIRGEYSPMDDPDDMQRFLSFRSNGGTDFQNAILSAIDRTKANRKDFKLKNADIVMVTDGHCHIDSEYVVEMINKYFGRLFVIITPPGNVGQFRLPNLQVQVGVLSSVDNDEDVESVFIDMFKRL